MTKDLLKSNLMKVEDKLEIIDLLSKEIKANSGESFKKLNDLQIFC